MGQQIFIGEGNLGHDPPLKSDGALQELSVTVRFQTPATDPSVSLTEGPGSFWGQVILRGGSAGHNARVLKKGDRVLVYGELAIEERVPTRGKRQGKETQHPVIYARAIGIQAISIESVVRRRKDAGVENS